MAQDREPLAETRIPAIAPVWPCVLAFAAGIVCDRWFRWSFAGWFVSACAALAVWLVWTITAIWSARRRADDDRPDAAETLPFAASPESEGWRGTVVLLLALFALGGLRHGLQRRWVAPSHAARWAGYALRPVRLQGIVVREPWLRAARPASALAPRPLPPKTVLHIEVLRLRMADRWRSTTGRVRVYVDGDARSLPVGTPVELVGTWHRPPAPRNPGEFDTRDYLRDRGIHAVVYCEDPAAVRATGPPGWTWGFARLRQRLRGRLAATFEERLSGDAAPLAQALLLGDRSELPAEVRDAFVRSGTVHILAISGLHVGLLVGFVAFFGRALGCSRRTVWVLVLVAVVWLLVVANWRPSVLRAALLTVLLGTAALHYRMARVWDALAGAAFILTLADPTTLFDTGAQLSFLAVAAILWWSPHQQPVSERIHRWLTRHHIRFRDEPPPPADLRKLAARLIAVHGMFLGIWLATTPLVANRFHVVSVTGLLLNVPAVLLVATLLCAGYGLTGLALIGWTWPLDRLFDLIAAGLDAVVSAGAGVGLGHRFVAGPSAISLGGFYLLAALALTLPRWSRWRNAAWSMWWLWIAGSLVLSVWPRDRTDLAVHVVAVGHGQAILIDCPGGTTLLFDAGSLADERQAAERIASALWAMGRCDIDAAIISHADIDHFNALPQLRRMVPIGAVFAPRMFFESDEAAVTLIKTELAEMHVPVRFVHRGDRLVFDSPVRVSVLWPPWSARPVSDNEASCVLLVEFAGRRILLPADLEGAGLAELIAHTPGRFDVVTAPHHGSASSSTPEFVAWARPAYVVVSEGRPRAVDFLNRLSEVYPPTSPVLWTHEVGAVTITVSAAGRLRLIAHRSGIVRRADPRSTTASLTVAPQANAPRR